MTPDNQKPSRQTQGRNHVASSDGLGATVVKNCVGLYEYDAEYVGGPDDGFQFRMVRRKSPTIGHKTRNNGSGYRLLKFKNGVAMYHYVCQL